jgi:hypothetical protein
VGSAARLRRGDEDVDGGSARRSSKVGMRFNLSPRYEIKGTILDEDWLGSQENCRKINRKMGVADANFQD